MMMAHLVHTDTYNMVAHHLHCISIIVSLFKEDMVEKQLSGVVRTNLCFEYLKQQILLPEREGVESISA